MSGQLVDQMPVPEQQSGLPVVAVDEAPTDAVRPRYWRRYRATWKWSFLVSVTVLAVGGAFAAQSLNTVFLIASGAIDGLLNCLVWASLANLVVAAVWKGGTNPGIRRRSRVTFAIMAALIAASLVAVGVRVSNVSSVQPVAATQTEAAQAYLTSHYTCQTAPKSDVVGRVACGTGESTATVALVMPPTSVDRAGYDEAMKSLRAETAAKGLNANVHEVTGWDPNYSLTIVELSR